jgi:hypothetical protein
MQAERRERISGRDALEKIKDIFEHFTFFQYLNIRKSRGAAVAQMKCGEKINEKQKIPELGC